MDVTSIAREIRLCPADQALLVMVLALVEQSSERERIRAHLIEFAAHPDTSQQTRGLIAEIVNAVSAATQQEASHE